MDESMRYGQRAAQAAQRVRELDRRRAELLAGAPVTQHHVDLATRSANRARIHAAAAHDRAAEGHDAAVAHDIGDAAAHQTAATAHRAARDADLSGCPPAPPAFPAAPNASPH